MSLSLLRRAWATSFVVSCLLVPQGSLADVGSGSAIFDLSSATSIGKAGGLLGANFRSNSYQAIQANRARFDVLEVDLSWTSDGHLVCLDNWDRGFTSRFGSTPMNVPLNLEGFHSLLEGSSDKPRNCDVSGLAGVLRANPDLIVVVDIDESHEDGFQRISEDFPDIVRRVIPTAFQPSDIQLFRDMGFEMSLFTLYKFGRSPERICTR